MPQYIIILGASKMEVRSESFNMIAMEYNKPLVIRCSSMYVREIDTLYHRPATVAASKFQDILKLFDEIPNRIIYLKYFIPFVIL